MLIPNVLEKVLFFFGLQNNAISLGHKDKELFLQLLNVKISQMVINEYLRFGVHIDIQVSYKILWLDISKRHLHFAPTTWLSNRIVLGQF
jgi:hypothetical protein